MTVLLIVLVLLTGGVFYGYHYLKAKALNVSWSLAVYDTLVTLLRLK